MLGPGQDVDEVAPFANNFGFAGTQNSRTLANTINFVVRNAENTETLASKSSPLQEGISYTLVYDTQGALQLLTD